MDGSEATQLTLLSMISKISTESREYLKNYSGIMTMITDHAIANPHAHADTPCLRLEIHVMIQVGRRVFSTSIRQAHGNHLSPVSARIHAGFQVWQ